MPAAPRAKQRKKVHEAPYLANLPSAETYEKSYMHRDVVSHVVCSEVWEFIITGSSDGHIKFWKKSFQGIIFAKHFRAHQGAVKSMCVSWDGNWVGSIGIDKKLKLFEVRSCDLVNILLLPFLGNVVACEFVHPSSTPYPLIAISVEGGAIHLFNATFSGRGGEIEGEAEKLTIEGDEKMMGGEKKLENLKGGNLKNEDQVRGCGAYKGSFERHQATAHILRFNKNYNCVLSADLEGNFEIWDQKNFKFPKPDPNSPFNLNFTLKSDTSLFQLIKDKTYAIDIAVSRDGHYFACLGADSLLRIFRFPSGALFRVYDESIQMYMTAQSDPLMEQLRMDRFDFGRRLAVEKEVKVSEVWAGGNPRCLSFDESGLFLLYASIIGVKIFNVLNNRASRILGKPEISERFLSFALYQGKPIKQKGGSTLTGGGGKAKLHEAADPTIFSTAYRSHRFYSFSRREPSGGEPRDILNEPPTKEELAAMNAETETQRKGGTSDLALIHTTLGDIKIKMFPQLTPKTNENFTTHAKNGYYDNCIFHRVIRSFMIQTGDPHGDGTGGESIWGGEFEDEFHRALKHDRAFTVSMANSGPGTNGSQFFITTVPCSWLDGKHTVFGRVVAGADIVQKIEMVQTNANDLPLEEIRIIAIKILS